VPRVDDGPGGKEATDFAYLLLVTGMVLVAPPSQVRQSTSMRASFSLTPGLHHPVVGCTVARFEEHHPCLDFVPVVFITAREGHQPFPRPQVSIAPLLAYQPWPAPSQHMALEDRLRLDALCASMGSGQGW